MSDTTTIQNLTPQGTWQGQDGKTFYKFDCILENGLVGEVNTMSEDKWSIGDKVVVKDHVQGKYGPRVKLDRPRTDYGTDSFRDKFRPKSTGNDDTTKGIIASWAVGCAMQCAGNPMQDDYDQMVLQLARIALKSREIIKDEVQV
jgi:hypothetical protein